MFNMKTVNFSSFHFKTDRTQIFVKVQVGSIFSVLAKMCKRVEKLSERIELLVERLWINKNGCFNINFNLMQREIFTQIRVFPNNFSLHFFKLSWVFVICCRNALRFACAMWCVPYLTIKIPPPLWRRTSKEKREEGKTSYGRNLIIWKMVIMAYSQERTRI
jgi:hypothetical protein